MQIQKRLPVLIFLSLVSLFLIFAFIHFAKAPWRENEPITIQDTQIDIKDYFVNGEEFFIDMMPLHFMTARFLEPIGFKNIRLVSVLFLGAMTLAIFSYALKRTSFAIAALISGTVLLHPLLFNYGTQLRFWSMAYGFTALGVSLYFSIQNGFVRRQYLPLVLLFLLLAAFSSFAMFWVFIAVAFIEFRRPWPKLKEDKISSTLVFLGLALFASRAWPMAQERLYRWSFERSDFLVFNQKFFRQLFSGSITPNFQIISILFSFTFIIAVYIFLKRTDTPKNLKYLCWSALGSTTFVFLISCLPLREIEVRYSMWALFVYLLITVDVLSTTSNLLIKRLLTGLLSALLLWEVYSVAWLFRNRDTIDINWEMNGRQILENRHRLEGVCFHPSFTYTYFKYSSPKAQWELWNNIRHKDCERVTFKKYWIDIYWKKGSHHDFPRTRLPMTEATDLQSLFAD